MLSVGCQYRPGVVGRGDSPKPVRRLNRVLQNRLGQRIVKVMKREIKQPKDLLRPLSPRLVLLIPLEQIGRRVRGVDGLRHKREVGTGGGGAAPVGDVRVEVGEDEADRLFRRGGGDGGVRGAGGRGGRGAGAVGDGLVEVLFDVGCGAAAAGAKVDEDVVVDGGAEVGGEDARGELRGGGALEEGDLGVGVRRGDPRGKGGRTWVVQATVRAAWTRARRKLGNLVELVWDGGGW